MEDNKLQSDLQQNSETKTRRWILGWLVTGLNLAVMTALAIPSLRFALAPLGNRPKEQWIDLIDENALAPGETKEVMYSITVVDGYQTMSRDYTVFVRRGTDGRIKCFDPACTHLGCRIRYQPEHRRYICPCHGGVFDDNGKVVSGPPPRPLVEYPVAVKNGRIMILRKV